jgi:enamine deaminase RidA (YjgF/YER057c/UK114 family)
MSFVQRLTSARRFPAGKVDSNSEAQQPPSDADDEVADLIPQATSKCGTHAVLTYIALVSTLTMGCMLTITVFLARDSDTMDRLTKRVESYMDVVEESQVLSMLGSVHHQYVNVLAPAFNESARVAVQTSTFVTAIVQQLQRDDLLMQAHQAVLEARDLLRIMNATLHSGLADIILRIAAV